MWQRTKRKVIENPFVFPALGVTTYAFWNMTKTLYRRDVVAFQSAQRFRIGAQIATIAILSGGIMYRAAYPTATSATTAGGTADNVS